MAGNTLDLEIVYARDEMAVGIVEQWMQWSNYRNAKINEWKELRNYLFATDTRTTQNSALPWSNSTTTPKLTQIRDNLHANYFSALFPNMKWLRWIADDEESEEKIDVVQGYMETKVRQSNLVDTVSDLLYDYIDTGNVFAQVEFANDYSRLGGTDTQVKQYVGPRVKRISPYDIVFNPISARWEDTPKIIRTVVSMGELERMTQKGTQTRQEMAQAAFDQIKSARQQVLTHNGEFAKDQAYVADGFSSIRHYYSSGSVELLTFYGDLYDIESGEFLENYVITVADRAKIVEKRPGESWLGKPLIFHAGWRQRPDNLYAMGPLDNLVGLQYRIDHLENMKADIWDQIAYPVKKIRGDVADFDWKPGEDIYVGEEGDVEYLVPDATALNADLQIAEIERKMEEMAGAPKQAMGFRTPGEKTAFEVSSLENAANRIFTHKTAHFERVFLEPILNAMLEVGRRNMEGADQVQFADESTGATIYTTITREDITANGKITPIGARHFAETARRVQELIQLWNIKMGDPTVGVHLSGKKLAELMSMELGEKDLFAENVGIFEQMETQQLMQEAQLQLEETDQTAEEMGL